MNLVGAGRFEDEARIVGSNASSGHDDDTAVGMLDELAK